MYWLATRNAVVSFPRWRSLSLLLRSPARTYTSFRPSPTLLYSCRQLEQICCFKGQKVLKGSSKPTKKLKASSDTLNDKDLSHLLWWKERLKICRKPSTVQLIKRLTYSNLLGLDVNLKNG
ncbi:hypothetical protein CMV_027398, partial [Castanea mollissima]